MFVGSHDSHFIFNRGKESRGCDEGEGVRGSGVQGFRGWGVQGFRG